MSVFSEVIPSLLNGVTEQPPALRRPSQAEAQDNCTASPAEGLGKRMPTRHKVKLSSNTPTRAFRHTVDRDSQERYAVYVEDGTITVYDLVDDEWIPVATPNGTAYLSDPENWGFRAVTARDYTFITNRGVEVAMLADQSPARTPEALVAVKAGSYSKTYKIIIDGQTYGSFTTRNSGSASHEVDVDTVYIAQQLVDSVNAKALTPAVTATRYGSDIYLTTPGGEDFDISTEDGFGGRNLIASKGATRNFEDLPSEAPLGVKIKVLGDREKEQDDYWVEFKEDEAGSSGIWSESIAPGVKTSFDPATMPHVLVREEDGTFSFKQAEWEPRSVGDEDSSPEPSFVGRRVSFVFFHRNRLGFLSGENIITSRGGGEHFNFWRSTMMTVVDTDPIDVAPGGSDVALLLDAVEYAEDLVVRSEKVQYVLKGEPLLTPKETSLRPRSRYGTSPRAVPIVVGNKAAGDKVYLPFVRGGHAGVWELSILRDVTSNTADDITEHVPTYIGGEFQKLTGSATERLLAGFTDAEPGTIHVYQFLWGSDTKLQSAWSKWHLGDGDVILDLEFIGSELLITYLSDDGVYLDVMDVSAGQRHSDGGPVFLMDRKVDQTVATPVFDGTHTTWTLPYATDDPLWVVLEAAHGTAKRGNAVNHTRPTSTTVQAEGDYSGAEVSIGKRIVSSYTLSTLYRRQQSAGGSTLALTRGRTQVLAIAFQCSDTGYVEALVTPQARDTRVKRYTGKILGAPSATIGALILEEEGTLRARVGGRNTKTEIRLHSDHYLPFWITGATWQGTYTAHTR